jgi:pimeloyl-ACP methyl ester carboxylesterase
MGSNMGLPHRFNTTSSSPTAVFFYAILVFNLLFATSFAAPSSQADVQALGRGGKMSNPTIVLIPGAWHSPLHYAPLIELLERARYDVVTERLPSVGSPKPREQSVAKDAAFIEKVLLKPLVDSGKDVLLLMHSYGGCPGADAAKGYSKAERAAAGKKGGIVGLVFMCAFVANEGDSLLSKLPGQQYDPWVIHDVSAYRILMYQ